MGATSSLLLWATLLAAAPGAAGDSHQATGVKVGEVTPTAALVWVRLTANPSRNDSGPVRKGPASNQGLPPGVVAEQLRDACPGMPGRVRVRYGTREDLADA